ncbi:MAG: ATP-binding protein [Cyanobacteria bacterium P01_G01_bin.54]
MSLTPNPTIGDINCHLESTYQQKPIRNPGSIQPHGVLLVLSEPELIITRVSDNSEAILGYSPEELIQISLSFILGYSQFSDLKNALAYKEIELINPFKLSLNIDQSQVHFNGILHRTNAQLLLELEPAHELADSNGLGFYKLVQVAIQKLHKANSLQQLFKMATQEIRELTSFDRVMVYRFNAQQCGTVVAEVQREGLDSFLGLNFPAIDIPPMARELFLEAGIRTIADVQATGAQFFPPLEEEENELDLSHALLRGVSPCHLQYLSNMGVSATLTIPLMHEGALWGLVACHHYIAKSLPYNLRLGCKLLGQVLSVEITAHKNHADQDHGLERSSVLAQLIESLATGAELSTLFECKPDQFLQLAKADGAALWQDEQCLAWGHTPPESEMKTLVQFLHAQFPQEALIHTDCLQKFNPQLQINPILASGVLAISLSEVQSCYLLWFRQEVVQTVNWAGNPTPELKTDEDATLLTPRKSFDLWQESVKNTALPWKTVEINTVLKLRETIQRMALQRADKLVQLNQALQASEARERQKSAELAQALKQLQTTHMQLVQSEKMSSLGQLVAGIAHEINNPVNFIYGNLVHTERYVQDLLNLIDRYQQEHAHPSHALQEQMEEIDFDFMLEDLPNILQSMRVGATRIQEIVKSLRNFSRLDEGERKTVDIHEGINSTLVILGNRLKAHFDRPGIQVVRDYGSLPAIDCFPGPLNQVFMNLLANAIDAIEERDRARSTAEISAEPSQLTITSRHLTGSDHDAIEIQIADNGAGIQPEHLERIFDPFFTTKPIGKGTGMGLAISYQIITEKHGGTLICESQPIQGTIFTIQLPHITSTQRSLTKQMNTVVN